MTVPPELRSTIELAHIHGRTTFSASPHGGVPEEQLQRVIAAAGRRIQDGLSDRVEAIVAEQGAPVGQSIHVKVGSEFDLADGFVSATVDCEVTSPLGGHAVNEIKLAIDEEVLRPIEDITDFGVLPARLVKAVRGVMSDFKGRSA